MSDKKLYAVPVLDFVLFAGDVVCTSDAWTDESTGDNGKNDPFGGDWE